MFENVSIIVPDANGGLPLRVMRCLGPEGARFVLISEDPKNSALKSRYCQKYISAKSQSEGELLGQLMHIERLASHEIMLPITTGGFQFVSRNRDQLSKRFRIPPISAIDRLVVASDKMKLFELSVGHEIPVLPSQPLTGSTVRAIERGNLKVTFPLLVKAKNREFGAGARKVDTVSELSEYYKELGKEADRDYFFQPYIDGDDFSLAVYCEGGKIKSHTIWKAELYGKKYTLPLCIRFIENDQILKLGKKLVTLLEWKGVCDVDFLVDKRTGEVWLLEVNARFWGNVGACLSGGVNFPLLMCRAALFSNDCYSPLQVNNRVFCYPRGITGLLKNSAIRGAIFKNPLKGTGLDALLGDPLPEFYRLYMKAIKALTSRD